MRMSNLVFGEQVTDVVLGQKKKTLKIKTKDNVLSKEECQKIINSFHTWERDKIIKDTSIQEKTFTKEQLDANTEIDPEGYKVREVSQSATDYIKEWEGLPVYRCKVMRYEEGDFVKEHRDSQWMCQSNYWKPNTNKVAKDLMVIPLNDDYEGGEFTINGREIQQKVGSVIQMPQSGVAGAKPRPKHGVKKVTKGTRYSMVFWNFE